ncbi:MAG: DNA polymerase III subunit delta' [Candidatus Desulfofervidaceae bacterium]|nr:DNA polymerase III subunit delta' [Candidatus Desulfofervidaceae bacterium]
MAFKDILGQTQVVGWLKNAIRQERLATAYLFTGIDGIGKSTVALNFAKVLNCLSLREGDACEKCLNCKKINAGTHPDVLFIQPEGQSIKIEQIRKVQHSLSFKPASARKRVVIINDADLMTAEAANAFLKTLEEPPLNTILILIAQHKSQLLPTIISRCQVVIFRPLPLKIIQEVLEKRGIFPQKAFFLAHLAEGSLGKALAFLEREINLSLIVHWIKKEISINSLLNSVETIAKNLEKNEDFLNFLEFFQGVWRDLLLFKKGCKEFLINENFISEYANLAQDYTEKELQKKLKTIEEARKLLKQNVQKKLILEHLFWGEGSL